MDAARCDALSRSLTAAGSRRSALAAALGGALGLLWLTRPDEAAAKKKCPPCKKRKRGKCKGKKPDGAACPFGVCQGGSCCVLESQGTTCAPGCGQRLNNCNQTIACPCPGGQSCLPNGTCARPCSLGSDCTDCTAPNGCSGPSSEGQNVCIVTGIPCANRQPCDPADTTGCPQGFVCVANCGGTGPRCVEVTDCPAA